MVKCSAATEKPRDASYTVEISLLIKATTIIA